MKGTPDFFGAASFDAQGNTTAVEHSDTFSTIPTPVTLISFDTKALIKKILVQMDVNKLQSRLQLRCYVDDLICGVWVYNYPRPVVTSETSVLLFKELYYSPIDMRQIIISTQKLAVKNNISIVATPLSGPASVEWSTLVKILYEDVVQ